MPSVDNVAIQAALQQWVVSGSGLPASSVYWGQQASGTQHAPRIAAPAIEMRLSVVDDVPGIGRPWLDQAPNPFSFATLTITGVTTGSPGTLTIPNHGLSSGDGPVQFASSGALPAPLLANTNYWVIRVDANTIKVCATFLATGGGDPGNPTSPMALTSAGSGTITCSSTGATLHAGAEIVTTARALVHMTLTLTCYTLIGTGNQMPTSILRRIGNRRELLSQRAILQAASIGLNSFERVRALHGMQDAVLFEPRAVVEVHLNTPSEESENQTIITTVSGTGTPTDPSGTALTSLPFSVANPPGGG